MVVRGLARDTSSPKVVRVRNHVIPRPSVDMYIIPAHLSILITIPYRPKLLREGGGLETRVVQVDKYLTSGNI
jgi:hypothetical protein